MSRRRPALPRRASIIFIQCDGLGYGDLSCYGQTKFQTPNLDKLAAEGIRFTNYFAAAASFAVARSAAARKKSGHLRQRADVDVPLAPDEITVAQTLKNSGYHTGFIGEWDLGDENSSGAPWKKGFDEFAGYFDHGATPKIFTPIICFVTRRAASTTKTNGQWNARLRRQGNDLREHPRQKTNTFPTCSRKPR